MNTYYFLKELNLNENISDIQGFSHSIIPKKPLKRIETVHINLTKSEEELHQQLHRSNKKQIKKASTKLLTIEVIDKPRYEDIRTFQKFYNQFAKNKNTYPCNYFHVHTMNMLIAKHALVITRILNEESEILCYRVYITDGETAFSLYSASFFNHKEKSEKKRLLSEANRYLLWQNILYFKKHNHKIYDMGGLTDNENIRKFKMEFGGEITDVYSGYEAKSKVGQFVLWLRSKKMRKG